MIVFDEIPVISSLKRKPEMKCYYCNRGIVLKDGAVFWHTGLFDILLHENCAKEFASHLCSDSINLKQEKKK